MIYSNQKRTKENYIKYFPEIENSDKKLYIHNEIITKTNWKDIGDKNYENFKEYDKIILDCGSEAIYFEDIDNLFTLLKIYGITNVINFNSGLNDTFQNKSVYSPLFLKYNEDDIVPVNERTKLFISLARLIPARFQRILLTYELYKNNLLKDGIVTCGSSSEEYGKIGDEIYLFPKDFRDIIPLYYDGPVDQTTASYHYLDFGKECLINIVQESSFDITDSVNYSMKFNGGYGWNRPFLTEKTAKTFNSGQIPLFLSVRGYVSLLKSMGFDVFDDIVDHSYDDEINPDVRIFKIVKELTRLREIGLEKLRATKMLDERFSYNKTHLKLLSEQMNNRFKLILTSWFFND